MADREPVLLATDQRRGRDDMKAERMRRIETNFAAAVARVPLDEPLGEGLVRRAEISGLRRIVARDGPLAAEARIELDRREGADHGE